MRYEGAVGVVDISAVPTTLADSPGSSAVSDTLAVRIHG